MTTNGADGVQPFPFDLPPAFLAQLGYERTAGPSVMPEAVRTMLRQTSITEAQIAATEQAMLTRQPRRWVALYWQPAGDELAWDDGHGSGAGQLDHWLYLAFLHELGPGRGNIYGWLTEHAVDLGSSEEPATHWLVVDRTENRGYVAPVAIARAIVRAQELEARP